MSLVLPSTAVATSTEQVSNAAGTDVGRPAGPEWPPAGVRGPAGPEWPPAGVFGTRQTYTLPAPSPPQRD